MYKRGGVWHCGFRIKQADGRAVLIQRSLKTADREVAKRVEAKLKALYLEAEVGKASSNIDMAGVVNGPMMLGEAFERFKAIRPNKVGEAQVEREAFCIKHLLTFFGNDTFLDEITPQQIASYKAWRYKEGEVAGATINRDISCLSALYTMASKEWGAVKFNPCTSVSREKEVVRDRYLSDDEEGRLLSKAPTWLRDIIIFALNTGLREGAIFKLQWDMVNMFDRTITIRAVTNKRNKPQILPMTDEALALLKRLYARKGPSVWVFPTMKGHQRHGGGSFGKAWRRTCEKAEIADMRFHDLRHTVATRLLRLGVHISVVMRILAHASLKTTLRYIHHDMGDMVRAMDTLSRRPKGGRPVDKVVDKEG